MLTLYTIGMVAALTTTAITLSKSRTKTAVGMSVSLNIFIATLILL